MALLHQELTSSILSCAYRVHTALGPGLLESAYEECLHYELDKKDILVIKQKPMPLIYEDRKLDLGYRIDLFVEGKVVIEVKSVEALNPIHLAQLMTYLKLSKCRIGFLINFNVESLKDGIRRVILSSNHKQGFSPYIFHNKDYNNIDREAVLYKTTSDEKTDLFAVCTFFHPLLQQGPSKEPAPRPEN
jgi:GxxExxY protein